jgi:hypothetical protein
MQSKYGKDGLVVITVSIDPADPNTKGLTPEMHDKVLKKLQDKKVALTNLVLDESFETVEKRLRFTVAPAVYLFDRAGKWQMFNPPKKNEDTGNYDELEAMVQKLVAGK